MDDNLKWVIGLLLAFLGIGVSLLGTGLSLYYHGRSLLLPTAQRSIAKRLILIAKWWVGIGFIYLALVAVAVWVLASDY